MDDPQRQSSGERGVGDALRAAIERTLQATAGPAATTRERAGELLDEVVRRGRGARDEIARQVESRLARGEDRDPDTNPNSED
jgi:polyhydroxyalkanoate synthesis regulator phasin